MKIFFFGATEKAKMLYEYIVNYITETAVCVMGCIDNDYSKIGMNYYGLSVFSLADAIKEVPDYYVICSSHFSEIEEQLIACNIKKSQIKDTDSFKRLLISNEKYVNKYGHNISQCTIPADKIVIYTCITGQYDTLNAPLYYDDRISYVCFTDDKKLNSEKWIVEHIKNTNVDNVMLSKQYKFHPERFFSDYELSIWVDGKYLIRNNLFNYVRSYMRDNPILCFPHPERNCIYEEAACCINNHIGVKQDIIRQIADYYVGGYPFDNGLYEMGCIVRRHNDDFVKELMNGWEKEVRRYSYRDQISFPYVCYQHDFKPDICDMDINDNDYLFMNRFFLNQQKVQQ